MPSWVEARTIALPPTNVSARRPQSYCAAAPTLTGPQPNPSEPPLSPIRRPAPPAMQQAADAALKQAGMDPDQDGPLLLNILGVQNLSGPPALSSPDRAAPRTARGTAGR